jgi:hypothetical protein
MRKAELCDSVKEAAIDELFRHRQPILCVIDPRTLLASAPEAAENRKGETWQAVLKQYPNLEFVVSDQASGLRKGVNSCGQEIAHQYDVFHTGRFPSASSAIMFLLSSSFCRPIGCDLGKAGR